MIHTIIKTERRTSDEDDSSRLAFNHLGQLHSICECIDDMSNIDYAAEWDGRSPWVVVTAGKIADLKMAYMGWPMEDQATYEARIEAEKLAWEAAAPERERLAEEARLAVEIEQLKEPDDQVIEEFINKE